MTWEFWGMLVLAILAAKFIWWLVSKIGK